MSNMNEKKAIRSKSTLLQPIRKNIVTDPQKNMLSTNKLNAMLHKLKKHYNDMNNIRKAKDLQVEILEKKTSDIQKQIKCKENFADIDFPSEKISIQDYEKLKETKEEIQEKIQNLIEIKNQLLLKYQSETEYGNTLNNLIEIEKKNYENLNEHLFETEEKINTIKTAKRNLEFNNEEFGKRQKVFFNFKKTQELECNRLDDVIEFQDMNNLNISEDLKTKLEENQGMQRELKTLESNLETEHKRNKEKILKEINKNEKIKLEKISEQNKLIKLVIGLDLIKNYFIDLDKQNIEINNANLLKSDDYKLFKSKEYAVIDEESNLLNNITIMQGNANLTTENNRQDKTDEENINQINNKVINKSNFLNFQNNVSQNHSNIHNNNTSNMNNNANVNNANNMNSSNANFYNSANVTNKFNNGKEKCKIHLKDLKDKLDNLDMNFDTMFNFYTKIINKTNFFHNHMINFNFKQISLESKKDQYTKRVRQIIEKNSKNIEDLIKLNPKFQNLLKILNLDIKNNDFTKIVKEKIGNLDFISKVNMNKYEEFYIKCQKYFSDLKTFNEFIIFNLEKVTEEYQADEASKEIIKNKFLKVKKNYEIEHENANVCDRVEYLNQLFIDVESEYIKEKSKLEKIEISISEFKRINSAQSDNGESGLDKNGNYKGFPYIEPYSKWSIEKLELEKINTNVKISNLKKFIDLKLFLEDENNRNHIFALDIPLEKQIYGFLNGINYFIENLKLSRSVLDICNGNLSINNNTDKSLIDIGTSINEGNLVFLFFKIFRKKHI
jgi:hypothetical protein